MGGVLQIMNCSGDGDGRERQQKERLVNVIIIKALNPQYWSQFKFNPQLHSMSFKT
jgi:hypothetical protein